MVINENLDIISKDIARVCGTMHKLTPFKLMCKSEKIESNLLFPEAADDCADFVYECSMRQGPQNLYELGVKYYDGDENTEIKKDTALTYFSMAGSQGHVFGMFNAGWMFFNGEGTERNYVEAFYWFVMAANKDNARGYYFLAYFYMCGYGIVEVNHSIAARFYEMSAESGHALAQFNIAVLYSNGDGVPQDLEKAKYWFKKAANQGNQTAKEVLNKYFES